jgi:hypothetical protein
MWREPKDIAVATVVVSGLAWTSLPNCTQRSKVLTERIIQYCILGNTLYAKLLPQAGLSNQMALDLRLLMPVLSSIYSNLGSSTNVLSVFGALVIY